MKSPLLVKQPYDSPKMKSAQKEGNAEMHILNTRKNTKEKRQLERNSESGSKDEDGSRIE